MKHVMAAALLALAQPALAETRLMMVEQQGCYYCQVWDAEVGDAYHLTDEGRRAPLMRVDVRDLPVDGIRTDARVVFTPTFILVVDGREAGRIEGYPGEDFFYGLLGDLLGRAGASLSDASY